MEGTEREKLMGYDFDRQRPISNYIVDFYCKELQMAIEIDGKSHDYEDIIQKDKIRQNKLESLGVKFLRFSDKQVKTDLSNVIIEIEYWIEQNSPTPNPSKEGN